MLCLIYLLADLLAIAGIILAVYFYTTIDEMKDDNLNPIDCCNTLNWITQIDFGLQFATSALFLLGNFYMFLWNLPMLLFDFYQLYAREPGLSGLALFCPTRIVRVDRTRRAVRLALVRAAFYAASMVLCTFLFVVKLCERFGI